MKEQAKSVDGKSNPKIRTIVFDFDGTLAELHLDFSEMKLRLSILAGEYLPFTPSPAVQPALEWLETLAAEMHSSGNSSASEFRGRAVKLILEMELEAARRASLFPFTRPLLEMLRQRGIKTGIITRNCEAAVRRVFPDMDEYCTTLLARDHVPHVKPNPDHLVRILRELSATPRTTLMVGDHPIDIQTGRGAGVLTAGVWSGNASEADLIGSGALWTARNCEDLLRHLSGLGLI